MTKYDRYAISAMPAESSADACHLCLPHLDDAIATPKRFRILVRQANVISPAFPTIKSVKRFVAPATDRATHLCGQRLNHIAPDHSAPSNDVAARRDDIAAIAASHWRRQAAPAFLAKLASGGSLLLTGRAGDGHGWLGVR
jgi:hypothetical protein